MALCVAIGHIPGIPGKYDGIANFLEGVGIPHGFLQNPVGFGGYPETGYRTNLFDIAVMGMHWYLEILHRNIIFSPEKKNMTGKK